MNIGVILASGTGSRFKSSTPKQFAKIHGIPCIRYVIDAFKKSNQFDKIITTLPDLQYTYLTQDTIAILGGKTRNESISKVLSFISTIYPKCDKILFHDAARPLIQPHDFDQYLTALDTYDSVITAQPITDSLYIGRRNENFLIQTPEAFKYQKLCCSFNQVSDKTAIYQHINSVPLLLNIGHPNNKITFQTDLYTIEGIMKYSTLKSVSPDLNNKTVLIFGSSGGVGSALVSSLKNYNCKILTPTHKEFDFSEFDLYAERYFKNNHPDVIINSAGIANDDFDDFYYNGRKIMNINFMANVKLLDKCHWIAKEYNKKINIILIGSSSATKGRPNYTFYSASKAALISLVESQSSYLSKNNVFVNCICPERINTPLNQIIHRDSVKNELLTPKAVAQAILSYTDTIEYGKIVHLRKGFQE